MNLLNRALISIKRQPIKNGMLLILIFTLGIVMSVAISAQTAIVAMEEQVMMRVPAVSTIQLDNVAIASEMGVHIRDSRIWDETELPTINEILAVANLPYVRAYDFYLHIGLFSRDLDWAVLELDESRLTGISLRDAEQAMSGLRFWNDDNAEIFNFRGVSNPEITDIKAGLLSLVSGRTFYENEIDNEAMVAIISQTFAQANNLSIGSVFPIHSAVHDQIEMVNEGIYSFAQAWLDERFMVHHEILEFEVIGIFDVEREWDYQNYQGQDVFTTLNDLATLHNRIYIPVTVADRVLRTEHEAGLELLIQMRGLWSHEAWPELDQEPELQAIFLLYDPRNLTTFTEQANELLPDFWQVVDLSDSFRQVIASMDTVLEIADLILWLALAATITVLTLTLVMLFRERRQEVGIYMALGAKKSSILRQFLIEIFFITTVGIVLALFTGDFVAGQVSRNMFEQALIERENEPPAEIPHELRIFNPNDIPFEELIEMYDTSLTIQASVIFIGISMAVVLVSTSVPVILILKTSPKKVL